MSAEDGAVRQRVDQIIACLDDFASDGYHGDEDDSCWSAWPTEPATWCPQCLAQEAAKALTARQSSPLKILTDTGAAGVLVSRHDADRLEGERQRAFTAGWFAGSHRLPSEDAEKLAAEAYADWLVHQPETP